MAWPIKILVWPFATEMRGSAVLVILAISLTSTAIWLSVRDTAIQNEQIIDAHEKTRQEIAKMMKQQDRRRKDAIEAVMKRLEALNAEIIENRRMATTREERR